MAEMTLHRGLDDAEVMSARNTRGWNELPAVQQTGPLRVLLRWFSSFLVVILGIAAIVAFALGERVDALTISLVVSLNARLGFVQEWKAETALCALREMPSPQAVVLRAGREQVIATREIVPGDILILAPGTKVAADAHIIRAADLSVDEAC
jgi:Ca2+-transporting ATPase